MAKRGRVHVSYFGNISHFAFHALGGNAAFQVSTRVLGRFLECVETELVAGSFPLRFIIHQFGWLNWLN